LKILEEQNLMPDPSIFGFSLAAEKHGACAANANDVPASGIDQMLVIPSKKAAAEIASFGRRLALQQLPHRIK
jgi:hypothetical protein